jgi:hypothetical protein
VVTSIDMSPMRPLVSALLWLPLFERSSRQFGQLRRRGDDHDVDVESAFGHRREISRKLGAASANRRMPMSAIRSTSNSPPTI